MAQIHSTLREFCHRAGTLAERALPGGYLNLLRGELQNSRSILDLGCGAKPYLKTAVGASNVRIVGADIFAPYLRRAKAEGSIWEAVQCDVRHLPFRERAFDVVVALDVIEHLSRSDGVRLIEHAEILASQKVIFYTPNGYIPQHPDDDNPFQEHRSGWTKEDFTTVGYSVIGARGLKFLRNRKMEPIIRPKILGYILLALSDLFALTMLMPNHAYHLFCIKLLQFSDQRNRGPLPDTSGKTPTLSQDT